MSHRCWSISVNASEQDNEMNQKCSTKEKKEVVVKQGSKILVHNPFKCISELPEIPKPIPPTFSQTQTIAEKLHSIQEFINAFGYNYLEEWFFNVSRKRPLYAILETAKEIIKEALPIRCLEGAFLALHFTQLWKNVDRIPILFRSVVHGQLYKHIVIAIRYQNKFGAIGFSRKPDLMYKPLQYENLYDMLQEYIQAYESYQHSVAKVIYGLPISHNQYSPAPIVWEHLILEVDKLEPEELKEKVVEFSKQLISKQIPNS